MCVCGGGGGGRGFCLSGGITPISLEWNCICNCFQFPCHFGHLHFVYGSPLLMLFPYVQTRVWLPMLWIFNVHPMLMHAIVQNWPTVSTERQPALGEKNTWVKPASTTHQAQHSISELQPCPTDRFVYMEMGDRLKKHWSIERTALSLGVPFHQQRPCLVVRLFNTVHYNLAVWPFNTVYYNLVVRPFSTVHYNLAIY